MPKEELIALLEEALQLPVLERKIQKGADHDYKARRDAQKESDAILTRIRAALAEAKTQASCS